MPNLEMRNRNDIVSEAIMKGLKEGHIEELRLPSDV
jgi:hypothetical protein